MNIFINNTKLHFIHIALFLGLIVTGFAVSTPREVSAQGEGPPDVACIGPAVADYIDAVMAEAGDLEYIKYLSPAFNMTSPYFHDMVNTVASNSTAWNSLDGIAGNAYNFQNGPYIPDWVVAARANPYIGNAGLMLTEIGWYEFLQGSDRGTALTNLTNAISYLKNPANNIIGAEIFNVFNNNPGWSDYSMSGDEINTACGGNCDNIGANSAVYYSSSVDSFYGPAGGHNMGFTIEIANNDNNPQLPSIMPGVNAAHERGMFPIIRIGVMDSSGGFDDPSDYADFLITLNNLVAQNHQMDVWVIVGPNEPITECWIAPECFASCEGVVAGEESCILSEWPVTGLDITVPEPSCACPSCTPNEEELQEPDRPSNQDYGQKDGTGTGHYTFFDNDIQDYTIDVMPILGYTSVGLGTDPGAGPGVLPPPLPAPPDNCISCPIVGGSVGFTYCSTPAFYNGDQHRGTDYLAPAGTTTYAVVGGEITTSAFQTNSGYGYLIILSGNDGNTYYYAHQNPNTMPLTGPVTQGSPIGSVGPTCLSPTDPNTGPNCPRTDIDLCGSTNQWGCTNGTSNIDHLHFEVRPPGVGYDPCSAQTDPQSVTPSLCQGYCIGTAPDPDPDPTPTRPPLLSNPSNIASLLDMTNDYIQTLSLYTYKSL